MKVILIIQILTLFSVVKSAKILILFTLPGRSHYILGSSLSRALAERGHDVTMVSAFSEKVPPKNGTYRDIELTGLFEKMQKNMLERNISMFDMAGGNPFVSSAFLTTMAPEMVRDVFEHANFQKLLKSNEKFDVVIIEQFMNDAFKVLAKKFDAPLILFSSVGPNFWVNPFVGNPAPPSYVSDMVVGYANPMTFCQRLVNSLAYVFNNILYQLVVFPTQNKLVHEYIPEAPHIDDLLYNVSLVLLNSHSSINPPVPQVPNMIEIGGFHVKPPKPLPKDLQEFLDNAKDGVVYFSMGSNLKSAQLPAEKREALLKVFSKLKQKVLWKWEEDVLPGQPPNVELRKWMPQQDILAHPNVKLFITHGGLLSTTETVYHGVPILAIPIFGDQKLNARGAVNNGYGLSLSYKDLSEESLSKNIREILDNPKYRINAKTRSRIFHDRLTKPLDTAMYWVEYVIRHKGAPHLRVAGLDLPWYQYHLLDVIAFVATCGIISLFISYFLIKTLCRCFLKKKQIKVKKN